MTVHPATGDELWHFVGEDVTIDAEATVAAAGDLVVVAQRGAVFALDPSDLVAHAEEDGRLEIEHELWRKYARRPWPGALITTEVEAVVALQDGTICSYAVADGDRRWCVPIRGLRHGAPGLQIDAETIVIATPERLVALDLASGEQRWEVEGPERLLPFLAVDNHTATVADAAGTLHTFAVNDGSPQWQAEGLPTITALAAANGGVIAGTETGSLVRVVPPDLSPVS